MANNNASTANKATVDWASVEKPGHFTVMVDGTVPTWKNGVTSSDEQLKRINRS